MIFTHPAESAVIEEAQQFRLHTRRHFANFIQQHRAAVSLLKEPFFAIGSIAKQLALDGIFRDRTTVQSQVRLRRARARQMASVSQQIFTGAGFPHNQQRRGQQRQLTSLIDHLPHTRADGDNLAERANILRGHGLQLTAHTQCRAQHDDCPRQDSAIALAVDVDRRGFQQEVLPVDHHMLSM